MQRPVRPLAYTVTQAAPWPSKPRCSCTHTARRADWRLLDFGIAARVGEVTFPACTPVYAAPEVLRALEAGRTVAVDPAHDIWALGAGRLRARELRLICSAS